MGSESYIYSRVRTRSICSNSRKLFILDMLSFLLFAGLALASPLSKSIYKRAAANVTNLDILNYALTLEHLEDTLYRQALTNFTNADFVAAGFPAPFYANLRQVSSEETTHVQFLTTAITAAGGTPVAPCTYKFPYTNPANFLALTKSIEGVGTSAYLGALSSIVGAAYVEAAGSIDLVEAMHTAYERSALKLSPFPGAFVSPLSLNQVYTLASQFIVACPASNPTLPVTAYPYLTLTNGTQATSGARAMFSTTSNVTASSGLNLAWISGIMTQYVPAAVSSGVVVASVPSTGLDGQVYAMLVRGNGTNATAIAGPAIVEIALPTA